MSDSSVTPRNAPPRLHFHVPPEPSYLLRARDRIRDYLRQYCAAADAIDDVVLCIDEACTNAIRHSGSEEGIELSLRLASGDLVAEVRDHGRGFDVAAFDPEALPDLASDHGRGLFLIASLSDEMHLSTDGGLEVRMVKKAVAASGTPALESGLGDLRAEGRRDHRDVRLRAMLEEIDEGFTALDWEYRYVHVNETGLRMSRKSREDFLGRTPWELWPSVIGSVTERQYREAMELGKPSVSEQVSVVTGDWLETRVYPTATGISVYVREINERKRTEQALRESEQRLRRFYEAGLIGVMYWNVEGEIVDANDRFLEMVGYTREELQGGEIDWIKMTPPEFRSLDERSMEELKATGANAVPFEKEYLRKDGTRLPVILAGAMLDDERRNGVAFVLDISERKQLEEALRDAEARSRDLIRYAPTGIYEIDFRGPSLKSVNDAMCVLTGYGREELLAMNPLDLLEPESQAVFAERIRRGLAGERIPEYVEYRSRTKDGRVLDVVLNVSFTSSQGVIDGALVVGYDITARKRAEEEQRLLLEAAGALAGSSLLTDVLDTLARITLDRGGHSRVTISLWDEQRSGLVVASSRGEAPLPLGLLVRLDELSDPARRAIEERSTTLVDYDGLEPGRRGLANTVMSHLALDVPIYFKDHFVGLLATDDPGERREFGERETELVEGIAMQAAAAIENARILEELRDSEQRFRSLFDGMTEGVALHEVVYSDGRAVDYRILDVNPAFERETGIMRDSVRGRLASDVYGTGDAPYLAEYAQVAGSGRSSSFETYFAPLERFFRVTAIAPSRGRFATVFQDITEQKRAEDEREQLLDRERSALQQARDELQATNLLLEAAGALGKSVLVADVLDRLAEIVLEATGHARVTVSLWDEQQERLAVASSRGESPVPTGLLWAVDELSAPARGAIDSGDTTLIDYDALEPAMRGLDDGILWQLALDVPLFFQDRLVGLLVIDDPGRRRAFSDRDIALVEGIAVHAAVAIENARLFEAERAAREHEAQRVDRLSVLRDVAGSAASSLDVHTVAASVVAAVLRLLSARQVQVRLLSGDRTELESAASDGLPEAFLERLGPIPVDSDVETAVCFRSGQPRIGEDVEALPVSDASKQNAREAGVCSYALLPLVVGGEAIGTFYAAWAEPRRFGPEELSFLEAVVAECATGLENARLYEAEQKAQLRARQELERTKLLQEVTTAATSSLSLPDIGSRVLALTTQALGATSGAIYAVDEAEGTLRALALGGYSEDVAREIAVVPMDEQRSIGYMVVHDLPLIAYDSDHIGPASERYARHLRDEGTRWFALPIKRGGATLGVFGFAFAGERPFEEDELALYRSIAQLLGTAFENARLFTEQRRIATTLQEYFVHTLPSVEGLEVGVVSHPAYEPELVGGDFSDVFLVDEAHVVVLIGDVAGKGVRAAGHTETVRSKVRVFATIDPSPAFILDKTNELLLRFDPDEPHVTAFLAVLDPRTGHLSYASAGHPAPIHLGSSSCRMLDVAFGPPLGSFERPYESAHVLLTLDDYLVLYTDGVTEARRDRELLGSERLLEVVAGLRGRSAQQVADGVRDATLAFAGRLRDDLQVVVLRLAGAPGDGPRG